MITSIVAAIAISQREARRKKAEQEAELEAASKKSVLIVSAGTSGLATAFLLSQFGFSVTIVDEREEVDVLDHEDALTVIPGMTVELMCKAGRLVRDEKFAEALAEINGADALTYRRFKSGKPLLTTPLSSTTALVVPTEELHSLLSDYTKARLHTNTKITSYHDAPEDLDGPLPNGRPYALAKNGKKFYADLIIVCYDSGIARKHVCETARCENPALKPTEWSTYSGVVDLEDYPDVREGANTWVGDESYLTGYKDSEEWFFTLTHLSDIDDIPDHLLKWAPEVRDALKHATCTTTRPLTARAPPASTVSRKSRKLLLMAEEALTLPPHSPHLPFAMHLESVATLAACLRKAASVPLGLEVYTRLRASRIEDAFKIGMTRLKTITDSAEEEELEASEVRWDVDDPWWTFQADKVADAKFELVIEILTQELLGKQKAMLEAEARRKEEEEKARASASGEVNEVGKEGGEEGMDRGTGEAETATEEKQVKGGDQENQKGEKTTVEVRKGVIGSRPDGPVVTKKTEKLRGSEVVAREGEEGKTEEMSGEDRHAEGRGTPTVAEQANAGKEEKAETVSTPDEKAHKREAKMRRPRQPSVADETEEEVLQGDRADQHDHEVKPLSKAPSPETEDASIFKADAKNPTNRPRSTGVSHKPEQPVLPDADADKPKSKQKLSQQLTPLPTQSPRPSPTAAPPPETDLRTRPQTKDTDNGSIESTVPRPEPAMANLQSPHDSGWDGRSELTESEKHRSEEEESTEEQEKSEGDKEENEESGEEDEIDAQ